MWLGDIVQLLAPMYAKPALKRYRMFLCSDGGSKFCEVAFAEPMRLR